LQKVLLNVNPISFQFLGPGKVVGGIKEVFISFPRLIPEKRFSLTFSKVI